MNASRTDKVISKTKLHPFLTHSGIWCSFFGIFHFLLRSAIFIPQANCVCGRVYCFHVVRKSVRPTDCVSVTFCFLNILKNHWWNFIKFCKHIHMYKANTTDEKLRARAAILLESFPFVILNGFCIRQFP